MIVLNEIESRIQKTLLQVIKGLPNPPTLRIAGGWVRDKLLGLSSNDIDIAIDNMNGEPFAHLVKEYMTIKGGGMSHVSKIQLNPEKSKHLETATARLFGLDVDFVNLRSETYNEESRNPTVTFGTPLQDALRRDITINALFYNLHTEQVEDFTGFGLLDMKEKRIRTPLPPLQTFLDDPLRILRVVRFASRFDYDLDPEISIAVKDPALKIAFDKKISRERVGVEITKMLKGPNPTKSLELILQFGFYGHIFSPPEDLGTQHNVEKALRLVNLVKPVLEKVLWIPSALSLEKIGYIYLACALAPYRGQSYTEKGRSHSVLKHVIMHSLKLSTIENDFVNAFLSNHTAVFDLVERHYRGPVDRKTIGLFIREIGKKPIAGDWYLIILTSILIELEKTGDELLFVKYAKFIAAVKEHSLQDAFEVKHILDGKIVASILGIKPGKEVGIILQSLMEWQLSLTNPTVEEATAWVKDNFKKGKRRRKIPLRILKAAFHNHQTPDIDNMIMFLFGNYSNHLKAIPVLKVRTLVEKIIAHHELLQKSKALPILPEKVPVSVVDPNLNLNIVSDKDLEMAKRDMDLIFQKNKVSKDAPGFKYDVKKDFGVATGSSDWDDDESISASNAAVPKHVVDQIAQSHALSSLVAESAPAPFKASSLGSLPSLIPVSGNTMNKSKSRDALADDMELLLNGLDKTIDQKVSEKKKSNPNLRAGFDEKRSVSPTGSLSKLPSGSLGSLSKSTSSLMPVDQSEGLKKRSDGGEHKRSNPSLFDEHKRSNPYLAIKPDEKLITKQTTPPGDTLPLENSKSLLPDLPALKMAENLDLKKIDEPTKEVVKPADVADTTSEIQECLDFEESDEESEFQKLLLKLNPSSFNSKKGKNSKQLSFDDDDIQFSDDGLSSLGSPHNDDGF